MAGQPRKLERIKNLEQALRAAGVDPATVASPAAAAEAESLPEQPPGQSNNPTASVPAGAYVQISDFRQQTLAIAEDCARRLAMLPDRNISQVYKDMMAILKQIDADAEKTEPAARPEQVREGAMQLLAMLPQLTRTDTELRELALDALGQVLEQTPDPEPAPSES